MMKNTLTIIALTALCVGCGTVRKSVGVGEAVANVGVAAKDDVFKAIKTLVDFSENLKNAVKSNMDNTITVVTQ